MPSSIRAQPIRAAIAALAVLGACLPAWAAGGHGRGGGHGSHSGGGGHVAGSSGRSWSGGGRVVSAPAWHGGAVAANTGPRALNNGHWFHGVRGGQAGWWWVAAAPAYLYLQPGYPVDAYGTMAVEPVYGYFCNSYQRYYPEVQTCPEPWAIVVPGPG